MSVFYVDFSGYLESQAEAEERRKGWFFQLLGAAHLLTEESMYQAEMLVDNLIEAIYQESGLTDQLAIELDLIRRTVLDAYSAGFVQRQESKIQATLKRLAQDAANGDL